MTGRSLFSRKGVIAITFLAVLAVGIEPAAAQDGTFQDDLVESVLERGWWDESGSLPEGDMRAVVERWGDDFAFAYSERSFDVQQDPALSAAALLAQSSLEALATAGGPSTLLLVVGDDASGATTAFPYPNVVAAMRDFDRGDAVQSFEEAAAAIVENGNEVVPLSVAQSGFFGSGQMFLLLGVVTAALALASVRSKRKKTARRVHTAGARTDTKLQIQEMSDLILELEPRVTIANDMALKQRYTDASKTYSEVLEQADQVETGHDVADLRIEIAKARWKLDVIDAELEGRTAPPEPFGRDNSGSAWNSTRGSGSAQPPADR